MWVCLGCCHQWGIADKVLWATAMVAPFLLLLSILHCPGEGHYEFFRYAFNVIRVFTLSAFFLSAPFLQMCYPTVGILTGWVPFSFHRGKKLITLALHVPSAIWLQDDSITSSFLASLSAWRWFRVCSFIGAGLQVGYDCFESFGQSTIEAVTL